MVLISSSIRASTTRSGQASRRPMRIPKKGGLMMISTQKVLAGRWAMHVCQLICQYD